MLRRIWLSSCTQIQSEGVLLGPFGREQHLIARDLLMGEHVREQAHGLGLTVYEVDGTQSLDEVAALVETHFGPWLTSHVTPLKHEP